MGGACQHGQTQMQTLGRNHCPLHQHQHRVLRQGHAKPRASESEGDAARSEEMIEKQRRRSSSLVHSPVSTHCSPRRQRVRCTALH